MGNAIKFTTDGSITILCEVEDKLNDIYKISVIDTGIGIKEDELKKLFKAFGKIDLGERQSMNI